MTSKEWKTYKLSDFMEFNPRETLAKGTIAKKIAMENLQPFCRDVCQYEYAPYNGGVKFKNGDTIMARITPCLENGKTSKINILEEDEIAFGSTEYIVFRKRDNISDENFIYYLVTSPKIREIAIKSMVGSSGRQRVQVDVLANLELELPPLKTQERIAEVLSSLDDKIELNNKINQNLEQQAQAIFDKYIKIPCNYLKTGTIHDYCNVKSGFAFKSSWWKDSGVKVIKIKTIDNESINFTECSFVDKEKISIAEDFIVQGGDLLIAMTGATIGKFAIVPKIDEVLLVNQRVGKFFIGAHPIKKLPFLYCTLKQQDIINDIINKGQGSAQPNISSTDILNTSCYILENAELEKFNLICEPIFEKIITNKCENEKLTQLRDTLLPKLMSGEIDVDKI